MESVPTKIGFRTEKRVRQGHEDRIRFPLNGKAPRGYWNNKLEFGLEVVREHPHSAVAASNAIFMDDRLCVKRSDMENALDLQLIVRRAFDLTKVERHSFFPRPVLWGEDVAVCVLNAVLDNPIRFRHADCFTLCFVHKGRGRVLTDVGVLQYQEGDYIFLPRKVTYAFTKESLGEVCIVMYEFPKRLMRPFSYWVDGFPFSQVAPVPAEPWEIEDVADCKAGYGVYVKRHTGWWTRLVYPFSPFDAVAWEGDLYPFVLHLNDIRAIASPDFHIEPKVLTTFVTEDESASVQTFKPRWSHSLPYPHQNYVTEVLFNHRGYAARPDVKDGCITVHPPGTFHGPDLRALKADNEREVHPSQLPWRDEVAVMLEVRSPLVVLSAAEEVEIEGYDESWYRQWEELKSDREPDEIRAKTEERME